MQAIEEIILGNSLVIKEMKKLAIQFMKDIEQADVYEQNRTEVIET